jgi:predicted transglutaminase-like cysteine proteinase
VQKYANEAEYIIDPINWGVEDYWATPKQFFIKDGDCEDYAIAKFMSLRKLGFKNEDMRVVVLNDTNLKTLHSVLVVYMDNEEWILDNQISPVVTSSQIHHYQPIYSINETNWWMHTS